MKRHPSLIPLSHEHQHGLALAVMIDRRSKPDAELARDVSAAWESELANHFRVEEEYVFPLADQELVGRLLTQHRELEAMVRDVAAAGDDDRRARLEAFSKRLNEHIRIEERQLFEQMQESLTAEQLEELGVVVERESRRACPRS